MVFAWGTVLREECIDRSNSRRQRGLLGLLQQKNRLTWVEEEECKHVRNESMRNTLLQSLWN